jgi:hypothetical protein
MTLSWDDEVTTAADLLAPGALAKAGIAVEPEPRLIGPSAAA